MDRIVGFKETESRVVPRGWGKGVLKCPFHVEKDSISVGENEKALEMDGSDACTTVWLYLMPQNYTLKND